MLKNELSIKAQHSYDVAIKIVEHREKLIKQKTAESISHYKSLVSFKNSKSEAILFAKRKELLKDNIEALFTKNPLDAKVALLKNNKDFHRFNWSFVKIDRNNPNKEAVKKQIALNRHSTVIYDMNYETALFEAKWSNLEKENEINTKLEMDRLSKDVYLDKNIWESEEEIHQILSEIDDDNIYVEVSNLVEFNALTNSFILSFLTINV